MNSVTEPARNVPVVHECDLCVVGGSCTGVFAAVRAARLGLSVCIIEQNVIFGGAATAAQVNEWHSLLDSAFEKPVIGGLTVEVIDRLRRRNAVVDLPKGGRGQFRFNSAELAGELDLMVTDHRIRPFLRSTCVAAIRDGAKLIACVIEDKSGRRAVKARFFIDASGDADLLRHAGFDVYKASNLQPVNLQALVSGLKQLHALNPGANVWSRVKHLAGQFGYPVDNSTPWFFEYPGVPEVTNIFGPRVSGVDGSDADHVTRALINGRHYIRALTDMIHAEFGTRLPIVSWAHALGVRQTYQARCLHPLTGQELLTGERFPDAIANGTYPIDIHHEGGTVLRYLDGREEIVRRDGSRDWARWRPEGDATPRCYHIPFRSLVPRGSVNLLAAGRVLDADRDAFGGVRVMVNMNQTGEAAGVACAIALHEKRHVADVDPQRLQKILADGGSVVL